MLKHTEVTDASLRSQIKNRQIQFGGYARAKIYGLLNCKAGRRMQRINRVFFSSEQEALEHGYRPCGNCMKAAYKKWKDAVI